MSKPITVLTIGPEYRGGMYLYHSAEKSADLFEKVISSKFPCNMIKLRGSNSTSANIIKTISSLSKLSENDCERIIIYYSGHGNHIGNKEYWDTASGTVDQIKISELLNMLKPLVLVISDSCSSEHMINSHFIIHPYVSIGATLDYQDAMMTCDGGLFTIELCKIIDEIDVNFTFQELINKVIENRIDVETFSIRYSSSELLLEKFYHQN